MTPPGEPLTASLLLVMTGLVKSRSEALRLIRGGGAYLNNRRLTPPDELVFGTDLLHGRYVILRKGRRHAAAAEFIPGEGADTDCVWSEFTCREG